MEEAIMTTTEQVLELGRRWAEAEERGDVDTLAELAVDDFTLVGPVGFVLARDQWLEGYPTGGLLPPPPRPRLPLPGVGRAVGARLRRHRRRRRAPHPTGRVPGPARRLQLPRYP